MNVNLGYEIAEKIKEKTAGCTTPESICGAMGIELRRPDLGNLKGMYRFSERTRTAYINKRLVNYYELLQTTYHEVGHDQIPEHREMAKHKPLWDANTLNTVDSTEREANVLVAHVLVDREELLDFLMSGYSLDAAVRRFKVYMDLLILELEETKKLMGKSFPLDLARLPRNADPCFLKASNGMLNEYSWCD